MPALSRLFAKVLRRLHLARWLDVVVPVKAANDEQWLIPLQRGLTESLLTSLQGGFKADLCKLLARHDLFTGIICDVGMNTGQTLLEVFGSGLSIHRYYGFEPNCSALAVVERLINLNLQLHTVCLMPWACSNEDTPVKLFTISELDSGGTLMPTTRPDWYADKPGSFAASYRLDGISDQLNLATNFFLKIDVEGAELDVLLGAERILMHCRPIIQCEVLHAHRASELAANDLHKSRLMALLTKHRYACYLCLLSPAGNRLEGLRQIKSFTSSTYERSPQTCDYLFLPAELKPLLGR